MASGNADTGSNVFYLADRVDAGLVIRDAVDLLPSEFSMYDTYWLTTRMARDLLVEGVRNIDEDRVQARRPEGEGSLLSHADQGVCPGIPAEGAEVLQIERPYSLPRND